MALAEANDKESILEQITMERLMDSFGPELGDAG